MEKLRNDLFTEAKRNIDVAQLQQKKDYDRKHSANKKASGEYSLLKMILLIILY